MVCLRKKIMNGRRERISRGKVGGGRNRIDKRTKKEGRKIIIDLI